MSAPEEEGAAELMALGAKDTETVFRGIHFGADLEDIYSIVYQTRLCSRILAPLIYFDCHSPKYLYKTARQIPWEVILRKKDSFAIFLLILGFCRQSLVERVRSTVLNPVIRLFFLFRMLFPVLVELTVRETGITVLTYDR